MDTKEGEGKLFGDLLPPKKLKCELALLDLLEIFTAKPKARSL